MKFLADMPISPRTVEFLRSLGHEAVRLTDLGMAKAADEEIIDYARRNNQVILTMDLDFGGLLALKGANKPSVITFRLENPEPAGSIEFSRPGYQQSRATCRQEH